MNRNPGRDGEEEQCMFGVDTTQIEQNPCFLLNNTIIIPLRYIYGCPIELIHREILRFKAFDPSSSAATASTGAALCHSLGDKKLQCAQEIDLKAGGKSKRKKRTVPKSNDIYLKLFFAFVLLSMMMNVIPAL